MENKKFSFKWIIRGLALLVLVAGSLLYLKTRYVEPWFWDQHREAGIEAFQEGNYPEVEKQFLVALNQAEKFPPGDPRLHLILNNLIEIYNLQSKWIEAEALIRRVIALDERFLGPEHPNVAASLNNLAENLRGRGEYGQAGPLYQRAIKIWENQFGPDHSLVVEIKKRYGRFLRESGQHEEAERWAARFREESNATSKVP